MKQIVLQFIPFSHTEKADMVFLHGIVITVNDRFSIEEAVAIKGKRIMKVGSDREIRRLVGPRTKVINLKGRALMPGFEDSHIHFLSLAALESQVDLSKAESIEELIELVKGAKDVPWVLGRGWDQEKMRWNREYRWPTKEDLDFTDKPVFLLRVCGHIAVANSKALEIAGISKNTQDPEGGIIDRYPDGEPTGVLREKALHMVSSKIPSLKPSLEDLKSMVKKALANGITCIEEAGIEDIDIYREALELGVLDLRVNLLLDSSLIDSSLIDSSLIDSSLIDSVPHDIVKERLRICGIKFYADGSLGGRTAALREPYSDDPSTSGVLLMDVQQLTEAFTRAHSRGLQCCTHAIGDRAIKTVLEANERSYKLLNMSTGTFRDRVEHCQIMDEELINAMKEQDMIASIQFSFAASDSPWAEKMLGNRIKMAYAWRTLMERGVKCCGGTDAPVETFVPLEGIKKIVMRRDNQALTIEQAIKLYTIDSAYAQWQDSYLGSIEEGKLADMVVLSGNPLEVNRLPELLVDFTLIDGKIVYERE